MSETTVPRTPASPAAAGATRTGRAGVGRPRRSLLKPLLAVAFLVLLESLSPEQRAVLLLHDVFGYGYPEITDIVGKSEDNAPITSTLSVQGDAGRSDPESLDRDRGPNVLDQRHTFTGSIVAMPHYNGSVTALRGLVNGTILGVAMQLASGVPVVASAHASLDEACGDAAVRADPESAPTLAEAIREALAAPRRDS